MDNSGIAEKLVKGFPNDKLRPSMYILVKYCIDEVGADRNNIIEKVKLMANDEELNKVSSSSFINKQMLRSFCSLSIDGREQILNELVNVIKNYSSKEETKENIPNKKLYNTKNTEISFKLDSRYEKVGTSSFDFHAMLEGNLELLSRICQMSIFDKDKKDKTIEEYTNFGIDYIKSIDNNFVEDGKADVIQSRKIRKQENGLQRIINQNTKTYTFESDSKISKISIAVVSGEGFFNKIYIILLIQICNKEDFSKYEGTINDNITSCIEHTLDTTEKKVELVDKTLGKVILDVDEERAEATIEKVDFDKSMFDDADMIFKYGDDSLKNLEDFMYYKDEYLNALNNVFKYLDKIKLALYKEAKHVYDSWLDDWYTPEEITEEFVKKHTVISHIYIYREVASLSAYYYDDVDEDRDLGGHGFDVFIDKEDFNNNCKDISWALNG